MDKHKQGRHSPAIPRTVSRPAQAPKRRRAKRSRGSLIGIVAIVVVVTGASAGGILLARNKSTRNISVGGQQVALPANSSSSGTSGGSLGRAPRFSIPTLAGNTFTLDPARGPLVMSFIAGWCSSCLGTASTDGQVARTFGSRGVRVLAIDADPNDSLGQLQQFISAAGNPPINWAWDKTGAVTLAYRVRYLDTSVIIDRQGQIVYRSESPTDYATFASVLKKLT